jgi:hypothetical protein
MIVLLLNFKEKMIIKFENLFVIIFEMIPIIIEKDRVLETTITL